MRTHRPFVTMSCLLLVALAQQCPPSPLEPAWAALQSSFGRFAGGDPTTPTAAGAARLARVQATELSTPRTQAEVRDQVRLERQLKGLQARFEALQRHAGELGQRFSELESRNDRTNLEPARTEGEPRRARRLVDEDSRGASAAREWLPFDSGEQRAALARHIDELEREALWLRRRLRIAGGCAALLLMVTGYVLVRSRRRPDTGMAEPSSGPVAAAPAPGPELPTTPPDAAAASTGTAAPASAPAPEPAPALLVAQTAPEAVARPARRNTSPQSPRALLESLMRWAGKKYHLVAEIAPARGAWSLGFASHMGFVRRENQDYGAAFRIGDTQVLIVADGMGGLPAGRDAAYIAVRAASVSVINALGRQPIVHDPLEPIARKAIRVAHAALEREGNERGIAEIQQGLRTTLIVLLARSSDYGYAYIGDGGGMVLRADGTIDEFLDPHKAEGGAANVLAASLGPTLEGMASSGTLPRRAGDLALVGSDGIFDRVEEGFARDVLLAVLDLNGDVQAVAERVVADLAGFRDETGFVCDDNLTLGLMAGGTAPSIPPAPRRRDQVDATERSVTRGRDEHGLTVESGAGR